MSTPLDLVLSALREHGHAPTRSGDGWECRCPAHADARPSLSIGTGDDGRALVHCHARCTVDAVCGAIGLRVADLYPPRADQPGRRPTTPDRPRARVPKAGAPAVHRKPAHTHPSADDAVRKLERRHGPGSGRWSYHDAAGAHVGVVLRWDTPDGKRYRPVSKTPAGWVERGMPAPRPLYRLPDLLAAPSGSRVWVCEGEKAADAARALGLLATTSPHGAEAAAKADWSPLAGRDVVILPDHDDAGEKYADDVARRATAAGATSVRVVRLAELWAGMPKGGDVADLIEDRGGDVGALRADVEALADKTPATNPKPVPVHGAPVLVRLSDVQPRAVSWLWEGRIPRGRLSVIAGRPGEGKSMVTTDWAARITTGRAWPDGSPCAVGAVVMVSAEDDVADTIRPRLDAHGADVTRVHLLQAVVREGTRGAVSESPFTLADVSALEAALEQVRDCALVVVDPVGSFMGGGVDAHRDNEVRGALAPLAALAQSTDAAVLLVAHVRKGVATHADDLVLGSRAFTGIARSVLHLGTDPENPERRLLLGGKSNLARRATGLAFTIAGDPPRVEWEPDPVDMTADDLLAVQAGGADTRGRPERDDAAAWLRHCLSNGPKAAQDVLRDAKAAGFSKRTIDRAKADAGICARKAAFGGGWVWELSAPAQEFQPNAEDCHTDGGGNLGTNPGESCGNHSKDANSDEVATLGDASGNLRDRTPATAWGEL